jgi:predicted GIY-YIG superfamily endonuclease
MPRMSRQYCKKTPIKKMGFSQKASCKAQGLIKRTSKRFKGKYVKSPKYNSSKNLSLYDNGKNRPKIKSGYGSRKIALQTIKNLKRKSRIYKKQIINTMYNRAKFHKYQTSGMRDAMKVFKKYLN